MTHSAEKELGELPAPILRIVWERIKGLQNEPRPRQCRKLKGTEKAYKLRVGDYRVVYTVDDQQKLVTVGAVRHRKEVYR